MQAAVAPNGAPSFLPPHGSHHGNNSSRGPSPSHMPFPLPGNMAPPRPHSGHPQQYGGYPSYGPNGNTMPQTGPYFPGQQHHQRKPNNMYQGGAGGDPYTYGNLGQSYGGNGAYYPPGANYAAGPSYPGYMPPQQMGGPGPGSMQNAPWNYQDNFAPRQQLHPGHPGENYGQPQPYPTMMNGHENVDHSHFGPPPPPGEGHYNHPQQPPPHFNPQDGQYPGSSFPPPPPPHQQHLHQHGPNHQQQPPYFPPGHPYANGGGFGYQSMPPLHQQPGFPYMTGPPLQPGQIPPAVVGSTPQRPPNKSLNPAARGFEFKPAAPPFRPSGTLNGNTQSASQQKHEPTFPSLTPAPSNKPDQPANSTVDDQPNGDKPKEWATLPVVNSTHLANGVSDKSAESAAPEGGLGLSQMERAVTPPRASTESVPMTSGTDTTDTTPGMTNSETSHDVANVETPRANTERGQSSSPPAATGPIEKASDLNFVGPTVEGYVSPDAKKPELPSTDASASVVHSDQETVVAAATASAPAPTKATTSKPSSSTPVGQPETLFVAAHPPAHDSFSGNSFKASIVPDNTGRVTKAVKTSATSSSRVDTKSTKKLRRKSIISMGNGNDTPMKIVNPDMTFGELSTADIPAIVIRTEPRPSEPAHAEAKVEEKKGDNAATPVSSSAPTPAPPVAKPKPTSWAALLGGGKAKAAPSETASMGPSSVRVSPSKSIISLMTETDIPISDPVTPKSAAPSLPPPSSGVSATNGPRPAFNYAAAAAAGKNISPENEIVKLLTEGLKTRSQKPALQANVPRGLVNTGNMCFANTILQMLVYCAPFAELFDEFGRRLKPDLSRRTPLIEALIVFIREFQPSAISGSSTPASDKPNAKGKGKEKRYTANDPFIPENVYDAMKENKRFDSLRRGHQEDAEEFLGFFLETLHEEVLHLVSRTQSSRSTSTPRAEPNGDANEIQRPVSPTDGWLEVGKKQKTNVVRNTETRDSAVSRIFGGSLRSVLHTPGQKDSVTLEPYQPLQLDIQSPTVRSITDALKQLNEPEIVPGVWSAARNCNVDATKQVYIETFPPVLILHLKRFVYDPLARDVVKKSKPIAYASELIIPQEIISPARRSATDVKYRLFAVDYHHGSSASGGHYTIAVSRQDAKGWIHFDDETHSTLAEEDVVISQEEAEKGKPGLVGGREKCAYLLFYQRVR